MRTSHRSWESVSSLSCAVYSGSEGYLKPRYPTSSLGVSPPREPNAECPLFLTLTLLLLHAEGRSSDRISVAWRVAVCPSRERFRQTPGHRPRCPGSIHATVAQPTSTFEL